MPKFRLEEEGDAACSCFSTLQRVEIAEIVVILAWALREFAFQYSSTSRNCRNLRRLRRDAASAASFSTLQRVEIAEIDCGRGNQEGGSGFSTLQRVEIAEIIEITARKRYYTRFSTLQRVEIAEIYLYRNAAIERTEVSVLFNESKLPK